MSGLSRQTSTAVPTVRRAAAHYCIVRALVEQARSSQGPILFLVSARLAGRSAVETIMRNVLFRGRAGRQLFAQYQKLPRLRAKAGSRADARAARTTGMVLACVYVACLLLSAYAIA